ncbi:MAG: hypothetical protein ACLSIB_00380 [Parabacteroides merdae]
MEEYSKYPVEVISGIAEETGMGMVCFLNPDTLETESVPGASYGSYECGDFDKYYQEVYRKVERWENCVRIDPPEPGESFGIMERFIRDCIPDDAGIKRGCGKPYRDGSHSEISNMSLMEANTVRNGLISDEDNSSGL